MLFKKALALRAGMRDACQWEEENEVDLAKTCSIWCLSLPVQD